MRLILRKINEGKPCLDYESFCQAGTVNEKSHSSSKIFSCCTSVSIGKYFTQSYLSVKRNVDDLLSFVYVKLPIMHWKTYDPRRDITRIL